MAVTLVLGAARSGRRGAPITGLAADATAWRGMSRPQPDAHVSLRSPWLQQPWQRGRGGAEASPWACERRICSPCTEAPFRASQACHSPFHEPGTALRTSLEPSGAAPRPCMSPA